MGVAFLHGGTSGPRFCLCTEGVSPSSSLSPASSSGCKTLLPNHFQWHSGPTGPTGPTGLLLSFKSVKGSHVKCKVAKI